MPEGGTAMSHRPHLTSPDLDLTGAPPAERGGPASTLVPLLIDIAGLAQLLARSVPSLHRDDAAGRLPAALRICGSKRWRYAEIVEWVELGCPSRSEFEGLHRGRR